MEIKYEITSPRKKVNLPDELQFGRIFTDHIFEVENDQDKGGWHNPIMIEIGFNDYL